MSKILIIGKIEDATTEINELVKQYFEIQLCTDNAKVVKSMLKMSAPDLVLMDIEGFDSTHRQIFEEIQAYNPRLPVVTYGEEEKKQEFSSFYDSGQCKHVDLPDISDIMEALCDSLHLDSKDILGAVLEADKPHIIVVDDNAVLLRNMRNMLQENYRVSLANSAVQCMKIMEQQRPDLIILDYEMPVIDGKQTLAMIRAEEKYKDIPVIFLTGIADKAHVDAVLDLKPAGYFVKPPMQSKIIGAIEDILSKQV